MPNWCANNISIVGPRDKITALWKTAIREDSNNGVTGLLEAMVPLGKWNYDTAIETWVTKWDVNIDGLVLADCGKEISGSVDTAWSPPIAAMKTYQQENPEVGIKLTYFEFGCCFCGNYHDEVNKEYSINPEDLSNIPRALVEEFNLEEIYLPRALAEEFDL